MDYPKIIARELVHFSCIVTFSGLQCCMGSSTACMYNVHTFHLYQRVWHPLYILLCLTGLKKVFWHFFENLWLFLNKKIMSPLLCQNHTWIFIFFSKIFFVFGNPVIFICRAYFLKSNLVTIFKNWAGVSNKT